MPTCRAQVLRLLKNEDDAMKDLDKAIELSGGKGKVAESVCALPAISCIVYKFWDNVLQYMHQSTLTI